MFGFEFLPKAQVEYEESLKWYLSKSESAGYTFISAVDDAINRICKSPKMFRRGYKHFHETGVTALPFNIIYFIQESENKIIIASVFHHKRNPKRKYKSIVLKK